MQSENGDKTECDAERGGKYTRNKSLALIPNTQLRGEIPKFPWVFSRPW